MAVGFWRPVMEHPRVLMGTSIWVSGREGHRRTKDNRDQKRDTKPQNRIHWKPLSTYIYQTHRATMWIL